MFGETGCDGVMVGRGALGNPWLIGNILSHLSGTGISVPSLSEREEIIRRHLTLAIDFYGEKVGTRDFRKHLLWYTKGLRGGARFRQAAGCISDRDSAWKALRNYFQHLEEPSVSFSGPGGCGLSPDKEREDSWGADVIVQEYPVDHPTPFAAK